MILKGVVPVKTSPPVWKLFTVLNKMIATASFTIPSPNTRENNFGYSSYLIIDIAAMTSDEQSNEHTRRVSIAVNWNCEYSL
jgi:hypothetical protein